MVPSAGMLSSAPFTSANLLRSLALFHSAQNVKMEETGEKFVMDSTR